MSDLDDTLSRLGLQEPGHVDDDGWHPFDPEALDPGIRRTVLWLRSLGYLTTDSGDGRSKPPGVGVLDVPHVVIAIERDELLDAVDELTETVLELGLPQPEPWDQDSKEFPEGLVQVEGSYSNGHALIIVHGIHDGILPVGLGEAAGARIYDEAAHHDLDEWIKASSAIDIRSGRIAILSTHYGTNSESSTSSIQFPDIGCSGDCGFEREGFGFTCRNGTACGRHVGPTDPEFTDLERYHNAMMRGEDDQ